MDLLSGGHFGDAQKIGEVSRMISEEAPCSYRSNCRKDSSDQSDFVVSELSFDGDLPADGDDEVDLSQFENEKQTREYFRKKIAIFEASLKTPLTANRRLAARKIEMEGDFGGDLDTDNERIPPKQLLMYLVR